MRSCLAIFLCFLPLAITWGKQTTKDIPLESILRAGDESKSQWLSPSGDFAFGFQQAPGLSGWFLLAIWFNKIPEKTITWSANGDSLADHGSTLQFVENGLVLFDAIGNEIWRKTAGSGAVYANLLDNGNFVTRDEKGNLLWQSFDWPTDTILPTQILGRGAELTARLSETNYSIGRFKLVMQTDGNLVAYAIHNRIKKHDYLEAYYATEVSWSVGIEMVFNQSGQIYVVDGYKAIVCEVLPKVELPTEYLYLRATIESDGVFRKYIYPLPSSTNEPIQWIIQDFQPRDICEHIRFQNIGYCGINSYCLMGDDKMPVCACPPGYSYSNQSDITKGCKRDFIPQSCLNVPEEKHQFELQEIDSSYIDGRTLNTRIPGISESYCYDACLSDCHCDAILYDDVQCWKFELPIVAAWVESNYTSKTFIKVRVGSFRTTRKQWDHVVICWE